MSHNTTFLGNKKIMITPVGGIAVALTNKTGATSVKGTLVEPSSTTDEAFDLVSIGNPDIMGIVYGDAEGNQVSDGAECYIVITGIAEVLFVNAATRDYFARNCASGDSGATNGRAISEPVPSSPFATDKHFQEVGHILETTGGAGLAKCIIHFN